MPSWTPSALEQEQLELVNRARMNPMGEYYHLVTRADAATKSALSQFKVDLSLFKAQLAAYKPAAPVAWSVELSRAATGHTQALRSADAQSHQLPGEKDLLGRMLDSSYKPLAGGENVYSYAKGMQFGHAGFVIDWGYGTGGMQTPANHRKTMLNSKYTEVGIAVLSEGNSKTKVGPYLITQDYGTTANSTPKLLGVVFRDGDNDNFYDAGEGLGRVQISVYQGSTKVASTYSWGAGGYQLDLDPGTYKVVFSGGGLGKSVAKSVVMSSQNTKLDLEAGSAGVQGKAALAKAVIHSGSDGNDSFGGGAGNDVLAGGAGNDALRGWSGADKLAGGTGDDRLEAHGGNDQLWGEEGNDQLFGGEGYDRLSGGSGHDILAGEGGNDALWGYSGNDWIWGNSGNDRMSGASGNDNLKGGSGHDRIAGDAGNDQLWGGSGNDVLWGGDGNDRLQGDRGADRLFGHAGHDVLGGGAGNDKLSGGQGNDWIWGNEGNDRIWGNDGNDRIKGGAGNDRLSGENGDDVISGHHGNDTLWGGNGADRLYGGSGNDRLEGHAGNDLLAGGNYHDILNGHSGNDWLYGEAGRDRLHGGSGNDLLVGGNDSDTFVFGRGDDADTIRDFRSGDRLTLDRDLFSLTERQGDLSDAVAAHARSHSAGLLLSFGDGDSLLLQGVHSVEAITDQLTFF